MKTQFHRLALFAYLTIIGGASLASAQTTVTFQQGVNGYSGTFDRRISLTSNENGADVDTTTTAFFIDGDPDDPARSDYLIRFDDIIGSGAIPANAIILDAQLTLTTTSDKVNSNSRSGETFSIYRLTQPFDSNSTLDGDFGDGDFAWTPSVGFTGGDGVEPEDGEADMVVGSYHRPVNGPDAGREANRPYSAECTRAVQSWVNGDTNNGMAIVSDHIINDDGWSVHSTGSSLVEARPLLTVTYTTEADVEVVELQQGFNGYAGTTDMYLSPAGSGFSNVDGSTVSEIFLDGANAAGDSPDSPAMIKFDLAGLPEASQILKAELIMMTGFSSNNSDALSQTPGIGYNVHQLLVPFSTASTYEDFAGNFTAMLTASQINPQVGQFADIDQAELVKVDVTSIVTNWLINDETNHGFYIGANGTSNGWQVFASGGIDSDLRPMLRITLKAGTSFVLGDANGDGNFDFGDIEAFFLAITDPGAYAAAFPGVDPNLVLDFDGDMTASFGDIEGFFAALTGG